MATFGKLEQDLVRKGLSEESREEFPSVTFSRTAFGRNWSVLFVLKDGIPVGIMSKFETGSWDLEWAVQDINTREVQFVSARDENGFSVGCSLNHLEVAKIRVRKFVG